MLLSKPLTQFTSTLLSFKQKYLTLKNIYRLAITIFSFYVAYTIYVACLFWNLEQGTPLFHEISYDYSNATKLYVNFQMVGSHVPYKIKVQDTLVAVNVFGDSLLYLSGHDHIFHDEVSFNQFFKVSVNSNYDFSKLLKVKSLDKVEFKVSGVCVIHILGIPFWKKVSHTVCKSLVGDKNNEKKFYEVIGHDLKDFKIFSRVRLCYDYLKISMPEIMFDLVMQGNKIGSVNIVSRGNEINVSTLLDSKINLDDYSDLNNDTINNNTNVLHNSLDGNNLVNSINNDNVLNNGISSSNLDNTLDNNNNLVNSFNNDNVLNNGIGNSNLENSLNNNLVNSFNNDNVLNNEIGSSNLENTLYNNNNLVNSFNNENVLNNGIGFNYSDNTLDNNNLVNSFNNDNVLNNEIGSIDSDNTLDNNNSNLNNNFNSIVYNNGEYIRDLNNNTTFNDNSVSDAPLNINASIQNSLMHKDQDSISSNCEPINATNNINASLKKDNSSRSNKNINKADKNNSGISNDTNVSFQENEVKLSDTFSSFFDSKIKTLHFLNFVIEDNKLKYLKDIIQSSIKSYEINKTEKNHSTLKKSLTHPFIEFHVEKINGRYIYGNINIHKSFIDNYLNSYLIMGKFDLPVLKVEFTTSYDGKENDSIVGRGTMKYKKDNNFVMFDVKVLVIDLNVFINGFVNGNEFLKIRIMDRWIGQIFEKVYMIWDYRKNINITGIKGKYINKNNYHQFVNNIMYGDEDNNTFNNNNLVNNSGTKNSYKNTNNQRNARDNLVYNNETNKKYENNNNQRNTRDNLMHNNETNNKYENNNNQRNTRDNLVYSNETNNKYENNNNQRNTRDNLVYNNETNDSYKNNNNQRNTRDNLMYNNETNDSYKNNNNQRNNLINNNGTSNLFENNMTHRDENMMHNNEINVYENSMIYNDEKSNTYNNHNRINTINNDNTKNINNYLIDSNRYKESKFFNINTEIKNVNMESFDILNTIKFPSKPSLCEHFKVSCNKLKFSLTNDAFKTEHQIEPFSLECLTNRNSLKEALRSATPIKIYTVVKRSKGKWKNTFNGEETIDTQEIIINFDLKIEKMRGKIDKKLIIKKDKENSSLSKLFKLLKVRLGYVESFSKFNLDLISKNNKWLKSKYSLNLTFTFPQIKIALKKVEDVDSSFCKIVLPKGKLSLNTNLEKIKGIKLKSTENKNYPTEINLDLKKISTNGIIKPHPTKDMDYLSKFINSLLGSFTIRKPSSKCITFESRNLQVNKICEKENLKINFKLEYNQHKNPTEIIEGKTKIKFPFIDKNAINEGLEWKDLKIKLQMMNCDVGEFEIKKGSLALRMEEKSLIKQGTKDLDMDYKISYNFIKSIFKKISDINHNILDDSAKIYFTNGNTNTLFEFENKVIEKYIGLYMEKVVKKERNEDPNNNNVDYNLNNVNNNVGYNFHDVDNNVNNTNNVNNNVDNFNTNNVDNDNTNNVDNDNTNNVDNDNNNLSNIDNVNNDVDNDNANNINNNAYNDNNNTNNVSNIDNVNNVDNDVDNDNTNNVDNNVNNNADNNVNNSVSNVDSVNNNDHVDSVDSGFNDEDHINNDNKYLDNENNNELVLNNSKNENLNNQSSETTEVSGVKVEDAKINDNLIVHVNDIKTKNIGYFTTMHKKITIENTSFLSKIGSLIKRVSLEKYPKNAEINGKIIIKFAEIELLNLLHLTFKINDINEIHYKKKKDKINAEIKMKLNLKDRYIKEEDLEEAQKIYDNLKALKMEEEELEKDFNKETINLKTQEYLPMPFNIEIKNNAIKSSFIKIYLNKKLHFKLDTAKTTKNQKNKNLFYYEILTEQFPSSNFIATIIYEENEKIIVRKTIYIESLFPRYLSTFVTYFIKKMHTLCKKVMNGEKLDMNESFLKNNIEKGLNWMGKAGYVSRLCKRGYKNFKSVLGDVATYINPMNYISSFFK